MSKKLYVGNLPFTAQEATIRDLFAQVGAVESVNIISDTYTGRSKGFGFVEMTTDEQATLAVQKYNGYNLEGRELTVSEARPKTPRDSRGGGGFGGGSGGGRGGFDGNRSRRY